MMFDRIKRLLNREDRDELELIRAQVNSLVNELESMRGQLPDELRGLSLDVLASYRNQTDRDAIEKNFGVGPLVIIQIIIAAWPLIKLIWELIGKDS